MITKPKPKRSFMKGERRLTGLKATANMSAQPVSPVNNGLSVMPGAPSQAEMQTQAATRLFLRRIEKITDAQIVRRGNGEIYPLAFAVKVPGLWSEAADQVYILRGDLYRKYLAAEIESEVRGKRESGSATNRMEQDEEH